MFSTFGSEKFSSNVCLSKLSDAPACTSHSTVKAGASVPFASLTPNANS